MDFALSEEHKMLQTMVLFLSSDVARNITGESINVDGGMLMY